MGALVAFELTRRLRDSGRTLTAHLFVSPRRAPHIPSFDSPISALPDAQFTQAIQERYNGIPAIILQDRDLLTFFLQVLRTDFAAIESYRFMPGAPLSCPVTVYGGTSDALADVPGLDEWKNLTSGPFSRQMFPGGHFYWQSNRLPLLDSITRTLDEHLD
jgi:medium-chain acyl-[acyl-carrier-protein] hydrolase